MTGLDMIDAVDPANIGTGWDGLPAVRISVLADPAGQVFDLEAGDAGAAAVGQAIRTRDSEGRWSWAYVNQSTVDAMTAVLAPLGLHWESADNFPARGVYLWAADPDDNIAHGVWVPPVRPIAIQRGYFGTYDLSANAVTCPARVAGYIDGPVSAWPLAAWSRFRDVDDRYSAPAPPPVPEPGGGGEMYYLVTCPGKADLFITGSTAVPIDTTTDLANAPGWMTELRPWPVTPETYANFAKLVHP